MPHSGEQSRCKVCKKPVTYSTNAGKWFHDTPPNKSKKHQQLDDMNAVVEEKK